MSATTRDKLEFVHTRATRATVRQCEALMRYAGTLRRIYESGIGFSKIARIQQHVQNVCCDMSQGASVPRPVFADAVLKIRVPDGGEVVVPS